MLRGYYLIYSVFTLSLLVLLPETIFPQDRKEFKNSFIEAEYFFLREDYHESAFLYNELLETHPFNANLLFLTGASLLSIPGQKEKAVPFLEKAVNNISPGYREGSYREQNAPRESLFALARAYHIMNRFDDAMKFYEKYKNSMQMNDVAEIEFVHRQMETLNLAKEFIKDTLQFRYEEIDPFKQGASFMYNAVFARNDSSMVFMVRKPFYSAIMMSRMKNGHWEEPHNINSELKADDDCSVCDISDDGRELYLIRNEEFDKNIYVSYFKKGKWSEIQALDRNINSIYNETHASVSHDRKQLFFISDRPGGVGARDIYFAERNADGSWGEPKNAGKPLNTIYSEETPFLLEDGKTLFFSSMGHPGMGGFDIYYSRQLPNGSWSQPSNLGFPVCTSDDDLFFYPLADGKRALFTSFQDFLPGGRILLVDMNNTTEKWKYEFSGKITTEDEGEIPQTTEIRVKDMNTGEIVAETVP